MSSSDLYLDKWFLDFIGDNGEVMIFYSAKLTFKGFSVHYSSWMHHHPENGLHVKTHFRSDRLPTVNGDQILLQDDTFGVKGMWQKEHEPIRATLFEDEKGSLDWHCLQPKSRVRLEFPDRVIEGDGYAEQLILTTYPWNIPMDHLRWGRFHGKEDTMVWIEIREQTKQKWFWLNGSPISDTVIEDDRITSEQGNFSLEMDRSIVLESEKKIFEVVKSLLNFIPGFNYFMPAKFLMATNHKWVSKCSYQKDEAPDSGGMAIHEWVHFNASKE